MALIPETDDNILEEEDMELGIYPTKTYNMNLDEGRVVGFSDDLESMKQVIFLVLNTERSTYMAFSDNYGIELVDLYGEPMSYVLAELERRITEALTWDSRIESVDDFEFEVDGNKVHATFTVNTDFGEIESEMEVEV